MGIPPDVRSHPRGEDSQQPNPSNGPPTGRRVMNRYERGVQFERLVALRNHYQRHGSADTTAIMKIEDAIVWAETYLTERIASEGPAPKEREESTSG